MCVCVFVTHRERERERESPHKVKTREEEGPTEGVYNDRSVAVRQPVIDCTVKTHPALPVLALFDVTGIDPKRAPTPSDDRLNTM